MVTWFGFIALVSIFIAFAKIEYLIWRNYFTPGVLLLGGYTGIVGLYTLATLFYEMDSLVAEVYIIIMLLLISTLFASLTVTLVVRCKPRDLRSPVLINGGYVRWSLIFCGLLFTAIVWGPAQAGGGFWSSDSKDVLGAGLHGHTHILFSFLSIWYAVSTRDRPFIRYSLLLLCIAVLSLYPVKGWTLIPVLALTFNAIVRGGKSKTGFFYLLLALLLSTAVFFGIYISRSDLNDASLSQIQSAFEQIFEHFLFYLMSGVSGLNAVANGLRLEGGISALIAPFVNFINLITGEPYINIISSVYVKNLTGFGDGGNVFSFIGSIVAYLGLFLGIIFAFIVMIISYLIYFAALRSNSAAAYAGMYYMLALFSFGWFDYYFWLLTPYEIGVLSFVIAVFGVFGKRVTFTHSRP